MTTSLLKKQHLLMFLCLLIGQITTFAQTVQIGSGTSLPASTLYGPVYRFSATSTTTAAKCDILYTAAEMAAVGIPSGATITAVQFNKGNIAEFVTPASHTMYMANTSNTSLATTLTWANILTTHTQVYSNTAFNIPNAAGWVTWTLTTPFTYTGGALEVATNLTMTGNGGATDMFQWEYTPGLSSQIVGVTGTGTTLSGTAYNERPNIRIVFTVPTACTTPPTAGTITKTPSLPAYCQGSPITLDLLAPSYGSGQTYEWESSIASTGPFASVSSSSSNIPFNIIANQDSFYRCKVTCSGISSYTTPVLIDVVSPLAGGTYTINSASPTGSTNFQSFGDAALAMKCGILGPIILNVDPASGPYTEQVTFNALAGTSPTNTITINGNGRTLQFQPTTTDRHVLKLDGTDYVTINNLVIISTDATYGYGIHLTNAADYNTIQNCVVDVSAVTSTTEANSAAIAASGTTTSTITAGNNANYLTIINDTLIGGYNCVVLNGASAAAPGLGCSISNNTIRDFYSTGVNLFNMDTTNVAFNDIHRMNRTTVTTFSGVSLRAGNIRTNVHHNKIHGTHNAATTLTGAAYGFEIVSCDAPVDSANVFTNNLIYDFNSASGTIYGMYNSGSDGAKFYHNTVVLDYAAATAGITRGFYQTTAASGIDIRNNIFYITRGGTGIKYCLYFNTTTSSITSDNNVLYMNATAGTNGTGYYGSGFTLLPDWKTANSGAYDQNSKANDPSFVSLVAPLNFTPTEINVNNIGANLGVATDFTGAPRGTTPDPGAYEFTPLVSLDAAITWVSPVDLVPAGPDSIRVNIENTLSTTITGIEIAYTDGTTPIIETFSSLSIAAGNSQQLTFSTPYNFTTSVNMRAYIRNVNGTTDGSQANDSTFVKSICVGMPGGTYTINDALPTGSGNYHSFTDAVTAISTCGITGPVVFNVDPLSGPYFEQISIPAITGASDINTITFNGNNRIIQDTPVSATRAIIQLDGVDYVTIDSLTIISLATDYGWGVHLTNGADYNQITNCIIDMSNVTSTTESYSTCIVGSGSNTSVTTAGNANYNIISRNTLIGGYKGIILRGATGPLNSVKNQITNNIIRDFYQNGMEFLYNDSLLVQRNDISRPNRAAVTTMAGIELGAGNQNCVINANRIHDTHNSATTQSGAAYGVYSTANDAPVGAHNIVSNNVIYNFNSLTGIQYGLYNSSSNGIHYHYNTVSLANQTSTSGTTRGFYQTTVATDIELKNNIFDVSRSGSGAKNCVYFNTAGSAIVSNNNLLNMTSTSGTVGVGYYDATNYITLANWKTANSNAYDQQSVSADPMFNAPNNFRLLNGSPALAAGTPVTEVLTDYSGTSRSATTPTIGAHEIAGDFIGPNIAVIPLGNVSTTTNRSTGSSITITDANDVDTASHKPRIYYKKSSDNNVYAGNTSTNNGWKWTVATNTASPFNFVIDYSIINGGSVSLNDTIQYFVVAQDMTPNHNVGTGAIQLNTDADSVELTAAHFPISGNVNSYRIVTPLSGTFFVGASSTPYQNLTDIAEALRSNEVTGNVIFELMPDYNGASETLPIVFDQVSVASPAHTIKIVPNSSVFLPLVTEGDPGSDMPLITIDGGDQMIFDGRTGGTGDSTSIRWIIRNKRSAATFSPTILLTNDATNNTLTYLDIQSANTLATSGTIVLGTSTQPIGNSYNTISNNYIRNRADSIGIPANAVYSAAGGVGVNSNNNIDSNRISNFSTSAISIGLNNGDNWNIRNNHIYYDWTTAPTTAQTMIAFAAGSNNNSISGNIIGGSTINADGTPWGPAGNTAIIGITAAFSSGTSSTISYNTIKNIARTNTGAGAFSGIVVSAGNASVHHNIIGDSLIPNSISLTGTGAILGISNTNNLNGTVVNIEHNRISNITSINAATGTIIRGIAYTSATPYPPCNIRNNRISNLKTNSAQTGYAGGSIAAQAIYVFPGGYSYDSTSEVSGNYIYEIEGTNTTAATNISGITLTNFWGSCHHNTIYGIKNYSQKGSPIPATANGLFLRFLQSNSYIHNNMISLTSTPYDSVQMNGIMVAGGTAASYGGAHVYMYNSVHISNANGGNPVNTYAFHRGENDTTLQSYQPIVMKNNLFVNTVTSLGTHYAVGDQGVAPGSNWIAAENNYNDFFSNSTNINLFGKTPVDLATWKTSTTGDANSVTEPVQFINPSIADLHLTGASLGNYQLGGAPIAGYTTDFDGDVRHITKPYMGADENTSLPLPVKLLTFTATASNDDVKLFWATASESNSSHFEIQRSVDGKSFKTVERVKAAGKSSRVLNYNIDDINAFDIANNNTLYYRLRMVDNDGTFAYSTIAIVTVKENTKTTPLTVFPNPFKDGTYVEIDADQATSAVITVIDITGKVVINYTENVTQGRSALFLNHSDSLKPGIYFITIQTNGTTQQAKLLKQ